MSYIAHTKLETSTNDLHYIAEQLFGAILKNAMCITTCIPAAPGQAKPTERLPFLLQLLGQTTVEENVGE